ncbi:MAG: CoA-binding protein [Halobacteriaceae archaeon]
MSVDTDAELREVLGADRIVVIGASTTPEKDAHEVPAYLQDHGYEIVPVNPYADEVLGEPAYDDLADVPGPIAVVDVFRPAEEVAGIVDTAIERGDVDTVWTQLGIVDDEAAERAREAGIRVVQDRCLRIEHDRLLGD